jgi:alpha-L-fucosidase
VPKEEYAQLKGQFNPKKFNADEWVALAQQAGMKYMVLTSRHHDGFCLWDTATTDWKATDSPAKRDFVAEYVAACRKAGMRIGFYYSLLDWRWPAYWLGPEKDPQGWAEFVSYVHTQVGELMTNYGKIDILWYDGSWPHSAEAWQSAQLNEMVRRKQPHIILNNRSGLAEDLDTPEQHITASQRPWESCMTMDDLWWGWHPGDPNVKSAMQLVRNLVRCVSSNGNYLLNVGPKADGAFPAVQVDRLKGIGAWMAKNSESIYGCGPAPGGQMHLGHVTGKGNTVYFHVTCWPGEEAIITGIKNKVKSARMLATGEALPFEQKADRIWIRGLPKKSPDPIDTVLAVEFAGKQIETIPPHEGTFWR